MHNRPKLAVGRFAVRRGPVMAGGAFFDIDIEGLGSHGARPERGVDAVLVGAQMVANLQSIISRNVAATEQAVVSVTQFHAGDAYNVIPQTCRLSGTARAFSDEMMALIETNLRRIVQHTALAMGATANVTFNVNFAPTINNADEADFAARICAELVGGDNVDHQPPLVLASEDFSYMLREVPGCYVNIGNGDVEGSCEVHNPAYDFNDDALPLGASFFARVVEERLA
jgi:hippurate hydrolase